MVIFPVHKFSSPHLQQVADFIERDEGDFAAITHELSRWQYAEIPFCRRLAEQRGGSTERPAVSTEAFKRLEIYATPEKIVHRFATSGTSGGEGRRGEVGFTQDDLALMDRAILTNAGEYLFPDRAERKTRVLVLAPPPAMAPQMIMAYGMDKIRSVYGTSESCFLAGPKGLDTDALLHHLNEATAADEAVTLIGASFGFVHLLDAFAAKGLRFALPVHSRVMDAGGFKGRTREVQRDDLVALFGDLLGIAPTHCVNLLGMTELATQFYDDTLAAHYAGRAPRAGKQTPPWTDTQAVDPETLCPLPHGEIGILRHTDLANGGHPIHIQTDDLGYTLETGFAILGRAKGSASRGCSISVDELLAAVEAEA